MSIKPLIKHLAENNFTEILDKSLLHCHCWGVHSIMLLNAPGKTIRLYIADRYNELFKNYEYEFNSSSMSVGFHAHHCDITLHVIKGVLHNWVVEESDGGYAVNRFWYHSQIKDGHAAFDNKGKCHMATVNAINLNPTDSLLLKASDIHTVAANPKEVTAWLVYEGKEDADYKPWCFSNADLTKQDFSQFYQKPTRDDIMQLLRLAELL